MTPSRSIFHKLFSDILPPPRFLEMPFVGLDISDDAVRFVDLVRTGPTIRIRSFGEEPLPKDTMEDGYIKNKEALVKALVKLRDAHNLHFVRVSLPEEKAYLFKTQIPNMDLADIRGAVRFKLEENVPVPIQDAVFDYRFIREPKPSDEHIDLGVAVIHAKVAESFIDILNSSGLTPLDFMIESQSIAKAVVPFGNQETYIVIAVRGAKTVLAIVSSGIIQYSTTLSLGGDSLASSIKKNFAASDSEVKNIREGREVKESNEMFQSLASAASVVRDEVQKLFIYWNSRDDEKRPIKKVLLCGSDSLLGLDDYLTRTLEVPVRVANVWMNILSVQDYVPPIAYRKSLDYASALGLALPYE